MDPPVSNITFFRPKEVIWFPLLVISRFFGPKEVSWILLLEMSRFFWTKGGQLDPPVSNITFFGPKEVSWIALLVISRFVDQRRSVGSPC